MSDTLRDLIAGLRGDLAAVREDPAAAAALALSADPEAAAIAAARTARGASRFAAEGASADVVAQLAAGGGATKELGGHDARVVDAGRAGAATDALAVTMKALAEGTASAGGLLVPVELAQEVTRLLRAKSVVMAMRPKVVKVRKEMEIPGLSSGASASYVAENGATPISEQTFAIGATLVPKELSALVPVSNRLWRDITPEQAEVIVDDIAEVLALRQDLAFLNGPFGSSVEPCGIRNTPGVTPGPDLGANGRQLTFDDLKAIPAKLRAINARFESAGWVFNPRLLAQLELIKDSDGRYLGERDDLLSFDATGGGGLLLLGYPFKTSSQIPVSLTRGTSSDASYVVFGSDWSSDCWVGENMNLVLDRSTEASYTTDGGTTWVSAYQHRQTLLRAVAAHDIALRRPQLFVVTEGVR